MNNDDNLFLKLCTHPRTYMASRMACIGITDYDEPSLISLTLSLSVSISQEYADESVHPALEEFRSEKGTHTSNVWCWVV